MPRSLKPTALLMFVFLASAIINTASAQTCIDEDGDGWGWDPDANTSCQVTGTNPVTPGGIKISWAANSAAENVSVYEVAGQINGGQERNFFTGNATEFSARLTDLPATYNDVVCVRVRAVRITGTMRTFSGWSMQSCITLPAVPLQPPQLIELSLIE
ncbi:hypothetical protein AB833_12225 [Chromatiales bacterium (ex Bugula neritina AB1)]|nr:hypothetical protein AB833_12225 [Chromatiales bacterium (ex Bugula neritina AB1)]